MKFERRDFIKASIIGIAGLEICPWPAAVFGEGVAQGSGEGDLPAGAAPQPVSLPHFPDRLHAFVWRNWTLVPLERIALVLGCSRAEILAVGHSMGLPDPEPVSADQLRRSYITIIRRNWHLLPYSQLLQLLDWTPEHMAYILQEDDFLYVKLGSLKPKCARLKFTAPAPAARERAREIAAELKREFPTGLPKSTDPLFGFVADLSRPPSADVAVKVSDSSKADAPRFCYSYFALYGDPLLEPEADPYPEGYLQRLAGIGVNGVWLQAVLAKLAPLPWAREKEAERTARLANLRKLAQRAERHGISIYLYLNEPRSMPLSFFKDPEYAGLKGVTEGSRAALCTSTETVRNGLRDAVAHICGAVPGLGGFFTITASENLTNCWSHGAGAQCRRCGKRSPAEVIAELNSVFLSGVHRAGSSSGVRPARLIAWDWGWSDAWANDAIKKLPADAALMSVSEWGIPIRRGGVESTVGEYSISTIGPGARAKEHWKAAHEHSLKTIAKIQAGNTWELSAVPYIPALENVARHAANLKKASVDGIMLGWTLGGYPSPNLEITSEISREDSPGGSTEKIVSAALERVAGRRFGAAIAPAVLNAWRACSKAFSEFPFNGGLVYNAPMQFGPSNLLWAEPTHYKATMIGFPYDDLDGWRQIYPPAVFIQQFRIMARGFREAFNNLKSASADSRSTPSEATELRRELNVMEACAIHFESTANQAAFVQIRNTLAGEKDSKKRTDLVAQLKAILNSEIGLARHLHSIQQSDSRIGFEASNQYYYIPQDLLEKMINCNYLLENWIAKIPVQVG